MAENPSSNFNKEQCAGLIEANPDITGLGVIIALLVQSFMAVALAAVLFYGRRQSEGPNVKHIPLEKALLKITNVETVICIAQMIATLVLVKDLTVDQMLVIADVQFVALVQVAGCAYIFYKYLRPINFILYGTLAIMLLIAGSRAKIDSEHPERELQRRCLTAYLTAFSRIFMWFRPDISYFLTGFLWPVVIGVCWQLKYPEYSISVFEKLSRLTPKMLSSGFLILTIIAWVVFLIDTINIYVAASHVKSHAADQEMKSFGQILALATVGTSIWDFYDTWKEWRRPDTKQSHSTGTRGGYDLASQGGGYDGDSGYGYHYRQ
ncbi:hypothetical protein BDD12DRAFT_824416 [Trichophaea hybrida]|nr:hypothetical protein BDD12DRAFT_824416 [Trichophaea hybrida]